VVTLGFRVWHVFLLALLSGCASMQQEINNSMLGWRMGFAALSGESVEMMSAIPETTSRAKAIAAGQPAPSWEVTFPDHAADLVHFLDDERVLVGSVEVGAYLGVPDFKDVYLFDLRDGKVLWKTTRPRLYRGQYAVLATQPHIILAGFGEEATHFLALDGNTGQERWRGTIKAAESYVLLPEANQIAVIGKTDGVKHVSALALDKGTPAWRRDLPPASQGGVPTRLVADGGDLFAIDAAATRIDPRDGTVIWHANPHQAAEHVPEFALHPSGLASWVGASMAWLDREKGEVVWRGEADGTLSIVAIGKESLYAISQPSAERDSKTPRDSLRAMEIRGGRTLWSQQLRGTVESNIAVAENLLVFTVDSGIVGIEAGGGTEAFQVDMPNTAFKTRSPSRQTPVGLPDIVEIRDGTALVARETAGGLAVRIADRKLLWEYAHHNLNYTHTKWADEIRKADLFLGNAPKEPAKPGAANSAIKNHQLQAHQARMQSWESMRQTAHQRAHKLKAAPDSVTRREAVRMNHSLALLATHGKLAETRYQIMAERSQAARNLADSIGSLAVTTRAAVQQTAMDAALSRILLEKSNTELLHASSFQGRYYLRPFRGTTPKSERGVALIDAASGQRHDLLHSPMIFHSLTSGLELPFAAVTPDGRKLLVLGVGLRPERWETVVNQTVKIPRPSLMAFELPLQNSR